MKKLIVAACLFAAGCMQSVNEIKPVPMSAERIGQIKSAVSADLKNPESAKFRNVRGFDLSLSDGTVLRRYCGEVSGHNSFGAYNGYEPFMAHEVDGALVVRFTDLSCLP